MWSSLGAHLVFGDGQAHDVHGAVDGGGRDAAAACGPASAAPCGLEVGEREDGRQARGGVVLRLVLGQRPTVQGVALA